MRWDAAGPCVATGPAVTGYNVYWDTLPRPVDAVPPEHYSNVIDVGNVLSYTIEFLDLNTEYFVAITAYNAEGLESNGCDVVGGTGYSQEVQGFPVPPIAVPERLRRVDRIGTVDCDTDVPYFPPAITTSEISCINEMGACGCSEGFAWDPGVGTYPAESFRVWRQEFTDPGVGFWEVAGETTDTMWLYAWDNPMPAFNVLYRYRVQGCIGTGCGHFSVHDPSAFFDTIFQDDGEVVYKGAPYICIENSIEVPCYPGAPLYMVEPSDINKAPLALATASTERTVQTAAKAIDGCIDGYPGDDSCEWETQAERAGAWLDLEWSSTQTVTKVILYDRPNGDDQITAFTIDFSDGTSINGGALTNDGSGDTFEFPAKSIDWLTLTIDGASGSTWAIGLSEIEVY